jgi:hypothetical protein
LRDLDVVGQRLAHVVNGQGRDRRAGQRLHFHTGAVMDRHAAANGDLGARHRGDLDLTILEPQRMTERYELVGPFRRHHAGDDGSIKHRPLAGAMTARPQRARHGARHTDASLGDRDAMGHVLGADVDHGGTPAGVDMREAAARHQPPM